MDRPLPFLEVFQAVGEKIRYKIDWEDWLALLWVPGRAYDLNEIVRPTLIVSGRAVLAPTGLQYKVTSAGASGNAPPVWPRTLAGTVTDGTITWTAEALATTSLETTVFTSSWPAVTGLTFSGAAIDGQSASNVVDTSSATSGNDYDVVNVVTMADGQIRRGTIRIKVR